MYLHMLLLMMTSSIFSIYIHVFIINDDIIHIATAVPEEFDYNPHTGKHGDRSQRMEIKRSSVEYIAPSEYMVCVLIVPCTCTFIHVHLYMYNVHVNDR